MADPLLQVNNHAKQTYCYLMWIYVVKRNFIQLLVYGNTARFFVESNLFVTACSYNSCIESTNYQLGGLNNV